MFRVDHRLRLLTIGGLIAVAGVLVPAGAAGAVPPLASITLDKTVAIDTGTKECGTESTLTVGVGTDILYCYTVTNTGNVTLDTHGLVDDELGTLVSDLTFALAPGESTTVTQPVNIRETLTNTATWTAGNNQFEIFGIEASASATVTVVQPSITLDKTVMVDSGSDECGTETALTVGVGAFVRYCYTVSNTGLTPLTEHMLVDDQLGTILSGFASDLAPGASVSVTQTALIDNTVTNSATWTAQNNSLEIYGITATDELTVTATPPSIVLDKTAMVDSGADECGTDDALSVAPGTDVRYCYTLTNTGLTPFNRHDLTDDQLGTLLDDFTLVLGPGESTFLTTVETIDETVTNSATWVAENTELELFADSSDALTVTVIPPTTTTSLPAILPPTGPSSAATNGVLIGLLAVAAGALALFAARRRTEA